MSIEETTVLQLDFDKLNRVRGQDVLPVAVQDAATGKVLLIAYTNQEALRETLRTGDLVLWSTSRGSLWRKGEGSGNSFAVREIRVNCEQNSLVYLVEPRGGGICHTNDARGLSRDCYYRRLNFATGALEFVEEK
ncbi:MAG: phosphoribosyl-AMP cyclohydrolase [Oscillospiraceae bacterium]|jgi:phosphoribosyl-AMP cyclohydrolase|nr:phosphoribosyl-AMP cyclohydrolase [Oscillospiraceae bacterium]